MDKTKILFLGRFSPPLHGAARMNELYFESLKKDKEIDIRKIKINYSDELEKIGKLNIKKLLGVFIVWFKLLGNLLYFRPKIVYFEIAPKGFAFFRDSVYVLTAKVLRRKIVFHLHARGIENSTKSKLKRAYYKRVFGKSKVIILSKVLYEDVKSIVPKKNIRIVPNGIPDEITEREFEKSLSQKEKNLEQKKPVLLFLSNMIESKGPLDVLEICNILNKEKINFECWFVGSWKETETKNKFYEIIEKYNLKDKCKYLGPKYNREKINVLKETNFIIFPTKYEQERFPLIIIESFMFGIPIASYNHAAIKEIISKDYLGYVSENKKPQEIAEWLKKNINKKQKHNKIRQEFKNNYELKNSLNKLKQILLIS